MGTVALVTAVFDRPTNEVLDAMLADHADVRHHLDEAWEAARAAVDPQLLELCRLRVAMLLDCRSELDGLNTADLANWPRSEAFGTTERACLAFTEQWVIDVASMDDATVAAVRDALGDQGLADFASALLVVEQRQRLRQTWAALFGRTDG